MSQTLELDKQIDALYKKAGKLEERASAIQEQISILESNRLRTRLDLSPHWERTEFAKLVQSEWAVVIVDGAPGYVLGEVCRYTNGDGKGMSVADHGRAFTYYNHKGEPMSGRDFSKTTVWRSLTPEPNFSTLGI